MKALAAVWLGLLAASFVDAADRPVVIIKDARIVTVAGPVIEKGSVLISGGKVATVGPSVAVPEGATVIDGTGKTVYPGLIDGLTSLGLVEIQSVPGSVDTAEVGDVNPHARAWVALNPHSEQLPVARANGITTALAAPAGGLISGQSATILVPGSPVTIPEVTKVFRLRTANA